MDNLKFAVVDLTDNDENGAITHKLKIFNNSPTTRVFSTIVSDFIAVQQPSPIFMADACKNFITDNISTKAEYKIIRTTSIDNANDTVEMFIPIFGSNVIKIILTEEKKAEVDYKKLAYTLQQRLDEMDPYEVIDTFTYPTWSSYAEFQSLPEWKYFDTFNNLDNYLHQLKDKYDSKHTYIKEKSLDLEYDNPSYDITKWLIIVDSKSNLLHFKNTIYDCPVASIKDVDIKSMFDESHNMSLNILEPSYSEDDVVKLNAHQLKQKLGYYFGLLFRGWVLYNPHLYKEYISNSYDIEIVCELNLDTLTMLIKRRKIKNTSVLYKRIPHVILGEKNNIRYEKPYLKLSNLQLVIMYKGNNVAYNDYTGL